MLGGGNRGRGVGNEPSRSLRGSGVVARLLRSELSAEHFSLSRLGPPGTSSQRDGIQVLAPFRRDGGAIGETWRPVAWRGRAEQPRRFLGRSEEHTSELQSRRDLVCRLLLEKKKK